MNLNLLRHRHERVLMLQQRGGNDEDRRAYREFARDYSAPIEMTPDAAARPPMQFVDLSNGRLEARTMRKKRIPESAEARQERLNRAAQERIDGATADDQAVDAAVRRSIRLHGA